MNDYNALLQHRAQVAEATRYHEHARLLRENRLAVSNTPDKAAHLPRLTRLVSDLKAALESLRWHEAETPVLNEACE